MTILAEQLFTCSAVKKRFDQITRVGLLSISDKACCAERISKWLVDEGYSTRWLLYRTYNRRDFYVTKTVDTPTTADTTRSLFLTNSCSK